MLLSLKLPNDTKLLVKAGQKLNFDTPFYRSKSEVEFTIAIAGKLDVPPNKIFHYLKRFVGETVEKGSVVAVKKNLLSTKKVISEKAGVIKEVNHHEGVLIISCMEGAESDHMANIKGEVAEIKKNEIKIKIDNGIEFPLKMASGGFGGKVLFVKSGNDHNLTETDVQGKIIIARSLSEFFVIKLEALGASGIVTLLKPESSNGTLPFAYLKNIDDFEKIAKKTLSCCFVDATCSRIILYD